MDYKKFLKPDAFETLPNTESCAKQWVHWKTRFNKFISKCTGATDEDKLDLLINLISADVYSYISDCNGITAALAALDKVYNPTKSIIFTRHKLNSCRQNPGETIDAYYQRLKVLARDCDFKAVDKLTHENEAIREAFLSPGFSLLIFINDF